RSLVPNGYNIQKGGNGRGKWSEESKLENGRKVREWYKENTHPLKGKTFSESHRKALSKVRKGFDSPARKKARETSHSDARVPIKAINIKTGEELIFESIRECALKLNLVQSCVCRVLRGKQNR